MNKKEYLALVTMEECAELQQALSKSLRFGFDDHHPEKIAQNNEQQVLEEYYQLVAMMEELQEQKIVTRLSEGEIQQIKVAKIKKVYQYMEYSADRNCLSEI
ncbi:nucleoside triphosphate pyrophosphohydrolase family protein [Enterococcus sp. LJL99]